MTLADSMRFLSQASIAAQSAAPSTGGPLTNVQLDVGVMLQFAEPPIDFPWKHHAFLMDDDHFDRTNARIQKRGIERATTSSSSPARTYNGNRRRVRQV